MKGMPQHRVAGAAEFWRDTPWGRPWPGVDAFLCRIRWHRSGILTCRMGGGRAACHRCGATI